MVNWFRKKNKQNKSDNLENKTLKRGDMILGKLDSNEFYKIERNISDSLSEKLEVSTLPLWIGQLYMHYWDNDTAEDYNNPEWQNKALYFWTLEELFPNKSLPPIFESMNKRIFRIIAQVSIFKGSVMPWFGMSGGGTKMGFNNPDMPTPIKEMQGKGIEYIEKIELSESNIDILHDREYYTLLTNNNIKFYNNTFFLNESPISLSDAYRIGVINIGKIVKY